MIILQLFFFLLPAALANTGASASRKIMPNFNAPVDFGVKLGGKRLFGKNKSIRGILFGVAFGTFVFFLQKISYNNFEIINEISFIDYGSSSIFIGVLLSFGSLLGDLIESFFKRRIGVEPGKAWFPFDQIDWIIGSFFITMPFINSTIPEFLLSVLIGLIIHLVSKVVGYLIKLDDTPF